MCPHCGRSPNQEHRREGLAPKQMTPDQIAKQVWKKLKVRIFTVLGVLSLVFGYGFLQAYWGATKQLQELLNQKISQQFESSKIHDTVQEVAKNKAQQILEDEIRPEVINFKTEVKSQMGQLSPLASPQFTGVLGYQAMSCQQIYSTQPPLQDNTYYCVNPTQGWNPGRVPLATETASTIALVNGTLATITDSGNGFVSAGFLGGQWLYVYDNTTSTALGTFQIASVASDGGTITLISGQTVTAQAAGHSITLTGGFPNRILFTLYPTPRFTVIDDSAGHMFVAGLFGGEQSVTVTGNAATCDWGSSMQASCVVTMQNASTAWTLTMTNPAAGGRYLIRFLQNATGGASAAPLPTFSPNIRYWQGNQTPALSTGASEVDYATCYYSGVSPAGYDCSIGNHYRAN